MFKDHPETLANGRERRGERDGRHHGGVGRPHIVAVFVSIGHHLLFYSLLLVFRSNLLTLIVVEIGSSW